ncbi:hypothetical protein D3C86_1008720 [compost metagenome]
MEKRACFIDQERKYEISAGIGKYSLLKYMIVNLIMDSGGFREISICEIEKSSAGSGLLMVFRKINKIIISHPKPISSVWIIQD